MSVTGRHRPGVAAVAAALGRRPTSAALTNGLGVCHADGLAVAPSESSIVTEPASPMPAIGAFAPDFEGHCGDNPHFHSTLIGGLWTVLLFHGSLWRP